MKTEKRCYRCRKKKSVEEFYRDKSRSDGFENLCKVCSREKRRAYPQGGGKSNTAEYYREKYHSDPTDRLRRNMRSRINEALKRDGAFKNKTTLELLGCSLPDFRRHLEALFAEGMTWENRGTWHIDHIQPCASFDLMDPEQQAECFHYSNLQPLWAEDNLKKSDKWLDLAP